MNEPLATLLVGLLVAMTSDAGATYFYLVMLSVLWNTNRWCFLICADPTGWKFTVGKWRWRGVQHRVGWVGPTAAAGFFTQQGDADTGKYRFSRFRHSQPVFRTLKTEKSA